MPLSLLNLLPVNGIDDPTIPVWQARDKWLTQLRIVETALGQTRGRGPFLAGQLESLRFLCGTALAQINAYNARGGSTWDPAGAVQAITQIARDFTAAVPRARAADAASSGVIPIGAGVAPR